MILDANTYDCHKYALFDANGNKLDYVICWRILTEVI